MNNNIAKHIAISCHVAIFFRGHQTHFVVSCVFSLCIFCVHNFLKEYMKMMLCGIGSSAYVFIMRLIEDFPGA